MFLFNEKKRSATRIGWLVFFTHQISENISVIRFCRLHYADAGIVMVMVTVPVELSAVFVTVSVMVALPALVPSGSTIENVASAAFVTVNPVAGSLPLLVTAASIAVFISDAFVILASSLLASTHVIAGIVESVTLAVTAVWISLATSAAVFSTVVAAFVLIVIVTIDKRDTVFLRYIPNS